MAGKKGAKHFGFAIIEEVLRMRTEGKTHQEISEYYNLDRNSITELIKRYNKKQRKFERGITPRKKGRSPKSNPQTLAEKDKLIKQLTMENELLRSFLLDAGRR